MVGFSIVYVLMMSLLILACGGIRQALVGVREELREMNKQKRREDYGS